MHDQSSLSPGFPRISVLINNYNNGRWLRACVDSVLGQTRAPDEVIVYDDGSTDESVTILRSYQDRIRLIEGVHDFTRTGLASQAHAVAESFRACSGEHIYLLDGDDVFKPHKLASYETAWLAQPEAVLVQAPTYLIDADGRPEHDAYEKLKHPEDGDYLAATYRTQDTDLYYSTSALAFSRSLLERLLPLDFSDGIHLAADSRLASLAPLFGSILTLEECLTLWRQHERSESQKNELRNPYFGTLRRVGYFNSYAARHGHRSLHLALNLRFYKQMARHYLPGWMSSPFARNPAGIR